MKPLMGTVIGINISWFHYVSLIGSIYVCC